MQPPRRRVDGDEDLQSLGSEIARLGGAEDIVARGLARLGDSLDLRWAAIVAEFSPPLATYRWGECPRGPLPTGPGGDDAGGKPSGSAGGPLVVALVAGGFTIGRLVAGPKRGGGSFGVDERRFVATAGSLIALALQGAWLNDELGRQVTRGERREQALSALNARLMRVQEEERRHLALELHDDPLQRAILLLRELNEATEPPAVDRWRRAVDDIVTALRAICAGLRPRPLDDFGLPAGVEWLIDDLRARCDVAIYLVAETSDGAPFGRYPPDLEFALFRVAQEALSNCVKHARAGQVIVTLWREADALRLTVADDGRGFPPDTGDNALGRHLGILGMRERLGPWGGRVTVEPGASGGTVVTAEVPMGGSTWHGEPMVTRSGS